MGRPDMRFRDHDSGTEEGYPRSCTARMGALVVIGAALRELLVRTLHVGSGCISRVLPVFRLRRSNLLPTMATRDSKRDRRLRLQWRGEMRASRLGQSGGGNDEGVGEWWKLALISCSADVDRGKGSRSEVELGCFGKARSEVGW